MRKIIAGNHFMIAKNVLCFVLVFLFFCVLGCGKKEKKISTALPTTIPQKKVVTEVVTDKQKKAEVKYEYKGGKYRNPLLSLTVKGEAIEGIAEMTAANLSTLTLRGIVKDSRKKRLALIDDVSGSSYIVKDKMLINQRGRRVKGVVGIVKEKSVVLMTSDKGIKELKIESSVK
ncbi:hypothetical protein KAU39_01005 [bacterium]|nr:hypothetical protein [bacterium]